MEEDAYRAELERYLQRRPCVADRLQAAADGSPWIVRGGVAALYSALGAVFVDQAVQLGYGRAALALALAAAAASAVVYAALVRGDHGRVDPRAAGERTLCERCRPPVWRPAGTRHCRVCDACVPERDHHCYWTTRCVGAANRPAFVAYLAVTAPLLVAAALLATQYHFFYFPTDRAQKTHGLLAMLVQATLLAAALHAALHSMLRQVVLLGWRDTLDMLALAPASLPALLRGVGAPA